jgi:O-methyltransferase domain/Dimerisation domain
MMTDTTGRPPTANSPVQQLVAMIYSAAQAQVIRIAAELGIADLMKERPSSAAELAEATGTQEATVARLMRTLTGLGLCTVTESGRYTCSPLGELLQTDHPYSLRHYTLLINTERFFQAWPTLLYSLRTGQSGFEKTFGMTPYASFQQHPDEAAIFSPAMTEMSRQEATAIQQVYDFSTCHTVVDVGGGQGLSLASLLQAHPALHGILLDLPHIVAGAQAWLQPYVTSHRCRVIGGDFLQGVPPAGDLYLIKRVLMDRTDAEAHTLLTNIRAVMASEGRVLVAEPDLGTLFGQLADMLMLMAFGTRLRTDAEFRELFARAGFTVSRTLETPTTLRLVEAVPR